jgi:hypothetical protein
MIAGNDARRHGGANASGSCGVPSTVTVIVPPWWTVNTACGSTTGTSTASSSPPSGLSEALRFGVRR